jgi:hypothetical protein
MKSATKWTAKMTWLTLALKWLTQVAWPFIMVDNVVWPMWQNLVKQPIDKTMELAKSEQGYFWIYKWLGKSSLNLVKQWIKTPFAVWRSFRDNYLKKYRVGTAREYGHAATWKKTFMQAVKWTWWAMKDSVGNYELTPEIIKKMAA